VPFGLRAVRVREPDRGLEAHHAVVVAQEDGAAIRSGRLDERLDGLVEELLEARRARDRVRHAVEGVDLAHPLVQLLALGDVACGGEQICDVALAVVERSPRRLDRYPAAVAPPQAGGDRCDRLACAHLDDGGSRCLLLLGVDELDEGGADDRVRVPAEQGAPRRRGVHDRPDRVHDRDEVVDPLEHELLEGRQVDEVLARRFPRHERIGLGHLTSCASAWSSQCERGRCGWEAAGSAERLESLG
jgi:hypothetical protein